jgi:elongation factor 1-beta
MFWKFPDKSFGYTNVYKQSFCTIKMGIAALKIKIMPESPETDLGSIQKEAEEKMSKLNAKLHSVEVEEIAFGLKALILLIAWPEEKEQSKVEDALRSIEGVQSAEVIDFRRAVG